MATLQERNGSFRVQFLYHGKREGFTLGQVTREEAEAKTSQVDYLLLRLKQRLAAVPPGMSIVDYMQFDGKAPAAAPREKITLSRLCDEYVATHAGSLEASTVGAIRLHFKHLRKFFGDGFPIGEISLADLQRYVDRRAKAKGKKGRLSATTIKKEIVSLRTAWNWAELMEHVSGRFPHLGLRYPKLVEKSPFQTMEEIEQRIAAGDPNEVWDSLYLQPNELDELLAHVKANSLQPFLYPMFCFAAHTGARRSEMLRALVADVNLSAGVVTIRERKRVKGKATTRRVPLTPFLSGVLTDWLSVHPGGPWLFCHSQTVDRSRKRSPTTGHKGRGRPNTVTDRQKGVRERASVPLAPLTRDEAHDHFKRVLRGSKWSVLRGWHALRHSFVSVCANSGVDQRVVEAMAGHMSADMSRRYTHLYPNTQKEALAKAFGEKARQ